MYKQKVKDIVNKMTLEEKASLLSGKNFWETKAYEQYGLKSHMLTDGPHGLRKQTGGSDHLGINKSEPATCFPTACASACSYNRDLLYKMGEALGDKCIREDVSIILGPGVNMKRSPLCGRNFEYFSEDPYLAGELAASLINGIQSKNVGASLKHFAANNQEYARMINDSNVDERALREIYLTAFEIAVKKSKPYTVMCSYNKVNGIYASTNRWLLTDVLRKEWGFNGAVVTDWGALANPIEGVTAGCDLEMPSTGDVNAKLIVDAINNGTLALEDLNNSVSRIIEMYLKLQDKKEATSNDDEDHKLARIIASESAVLLKNEDSILPFKDEDDVLVIGKMAKSPRYQGAGSSKIVVTKLDNIYDEAISQNKKVTYIDGYDKNAASQELIDEAVSEAKKHQKVLIVVGLPDVFESEGFDRENINMPSSHVKLIEEVTKVNNNVVVVLQCGAPCSLPFKDDVKAILLTYLSGQAGGSACVDLLWGKVNPSGKLAETWPINLEDNPSYLNFPGAVKAVSYKESIYIGYRYYNTVNMDVNYPFGYGLSYTEFKYDNLHIKKKDNSNYEVSVDITNVGNYPGKEIVELYVSKNNSAIFRSSQEFKAFEKVELNPNETKTIKLLLDESSFRYYNTEAKKYCVEGGEYLISIGKSSRDIELKGTITIEGDGQEKLLVENYKELNSYNNPSSPFTVDEKEFETLLGHKPSVGDLDKKGEFTSSSCLLDIKDTLIGKIVNSLISKNTSALEDNADEGMKQNASSMMSTMPIRAFTMSGSIAPNQIEGLVDILNGHFFKGIKKFKK